MNKLIKNTIKVFVFATLFFGVFYYADKVFALSDEPILIEINDTQIGTTAFEQLIQYGNGGHAAMGALLGEAQGMQINPGIGFSIGSGGNGYRPSILIAVWTDQPFDTAVAIATIKSHLNVPTTPVTTNGDCAIACDGTYQEAPVSTVQPTVVQTPAPEPQSAPELTPVVSQPASSTPVLQTEEAPPAPQISQDNTPVYTAPTIIVETNSAFSSPYVAPVEVDTVITSKPVVNKNKIISKNIKSKKSKKVLTKIK